MTRGRTLAALAALTAALPFNLALTLLALARGRRWPRRSPPRPLTVLISGGKMTKALTLARAFHRAGHRVVLVEQAKYRWTGHRFSRAVDAFHTVPKPDAPGYADALLAIVRAEAVDVYVPVCSPAASVWDARAKARLAEDCVVLHPDAELVERLDDKHAFAQLCGELGLPVPAAHRVSAPAQVTEAAANGDGPYVLKSIAYDPVNRLDLTPLPRPTRAETDAFARGKPITAENPWVLQAFVDGPELCAHATARDGVMTAYCCCASSAFQVNYAHIERPAVEAWVRCFVSEAGVTGQVCFDFIEGADGTPYAIECNPRAHSAITTFHDHPDFADAYLGAACDLRPLPASRPTYWLYHELWRALSRPAAAWSRLRVVARGKDAIFDWADPLPFLAVHHLQIPRLLLSSLVRGNDWIRIDFNIGKLVEPAGD